MGYKIPMYHNPAEFIIDLVNTDFGRDLEHAEQSLEKIHNFWDKSDNAIAIAHEIEGETEGSNLSNIEDGFNSSTNKFGILVTLIHRSFIKSYRDVIAYGIRIVMYMGLAIMMGTVWLRLGTGQENIVAFTNAIFFGGAFMSFMAVAYIPAFLEDRSIFVKERANGLYGPMAFIISNFIIGLPYLCEYSFSSDLLNTNCCLVLISVLFSVVTYWLSNFRPSAEGFWIWVMWLFVSLQGAPDFVFLLTISARPSCRRIPRSILIQPYAYIRHCSCSYSICKRPLDER
jgi:hypothetical protein